MSSLLPTQFLIQGAPLPATFKGKPNDLFQLMLARMRIVSPTGIVSIFIGDDEPTSNVGPWLKSGTQWFVWDSNLKRYVPLDISESETRWFWVGSDTPPNTTPPVWLKTTSNATEAAPVFGEPVSWNLHNGTDWIQLPTLIDDRSITQAKLDFQANFFGAASGTNNYSLTFSPGTGFSYGDGTADSFLCFIKFVNANTGPATLNINGAGARGVKKNTSQDIGPGEIGAGSVHTLIFDGTNFQILSPLINTVVAPAAIGGVASSEGLIITNEATTPDEILTITANAVLLQTSAGSSFQASNVNLEVDITTSGLGGIDIGTEAFSTWYFVWLVSNGINTSAVLSLSSTAVNTTLLPAGYSYFGLIGAVYNDAASNLIRLWQSARRTRTVVTSIITALATGPNSIDTAVPTIAKSVFGVAYLGSAALNIEQIGVLSGDLSLIGAQDVLLETDGTGDVRSIGFFDLPLITSQSVFFTGSGTASPTLDISGFTI